VEKLFIFISLDSISSAAAKKDRDGELVLETVRKKQATTRIAPMIV
jgi:hypothetical protein